MTSLFIAFLATIIPSFAMPKKVILIRHAEKIPGENHLDLKGFERAEALPFYFENTPMYSEPPITYIFATGLNQADSSLRPIQTCSPTANRYNLPLNIDFKYNETSEIAKEILTNPKYDNSTVLICWDHVHIRKIVTALGAPDPGRWEKDIFDQVYLMTFQEGQKPQLQTFLQKLMLGDRTTFSDSPPPLPPTTNHLVDEDV